MPLGDETRIVRRQEVTFKEFSTTNLPFNDKTGLPAPPSVGTGAGRQGLRSPNL
jgi:hypothetical protein